MGEEYRDVFYERLRTEIVRAAVTDYKRALRKSRRAGYVSDEQIQLEKWFLSKWGQLLSGYNGEYIIERCRRTYRAYDRKLHASPISPEVEKKAHQDYKAGLSRDEIMEKHNITRFQYFQMLKRYGR